MKEKEERGLKSFNCFSSFFKRLVTNLLKCRLKNLARLWLAAGLVWATFQPQAINFLLASNLALACAIFLLRFKLLPEAKKVSRLCLIGKEEEQGAFVSVHLPILDESPELALKTLQSLEKLDYKNFEVIVLNFTDGKKGGRNDGNEGEWRAVRKFCRKKSAVFKHKSVGKLEGLKGKALNFCLKMSDPRTKYILTVEPGFCVTPHLLKKGVAKIKETNGDFLQFPQTFSKGAQEKTYFEMERAHYFQIFMRAKGAADSPLLTGSLSLLKKSAVTQVGGWPEHVVAEHAHMGVTLLKNGRKGSYDHSLVGQGPMPLNLKSLREQTSKWVFGNSQVLFNLSLQDLARLGKRRSLALLLQLTAWHDFLFLPLAYFLVATLNLAIPAANLPDAPGAAMLAAATILISLYSKLLFFLQKLSSILPTKKIFAVYFTHFGLALESNLPWVESLGSRGGPFVSRPIAFNSSSFASLLSPAVWALIAAMASVYLFQNNQKMASVTPFFTASLILTGALMLHSQLKKLSS